MRVAWTTTVCRSMPQQPSLSFDGVIDKGCLDAVLCGEELGGQQVVEECHRWVAKTVRDITFLFCGSVCVCRHEVSGRDSQTPESCYVRQRC